MAFLAVTSISVIGLYIAYTITGVGYQVQYAISQLAAGTWQPGYKAFGLAMGPKASGIAVCNGTPAMNDALKKIEQDILSGKYKGCNTISVRVDNDLAERALVFEPSQKDEAPALAGVGGGESSAVKPKS